VQKPVGIVTHTAVSKVSLCIWWRKELQCSKKPRRWAVPGIIAMIIVRHHKPKLSDVIVASGLERRPAVSSHKLPRILPWGEV